MKLTNFAKLLFFIPLFLSPTFAAVDLEEDATVTIIVGPLVDSTNASAETGLTISQADVRLSKNGGNMAQKNDATSCTHDELGKYACPLNATDTSTPGILNVTIGESGTLVWSRDYRVIASEFYQVLDGTVSLMTSRQAGNMIDTTVTGSPSGTSVPLTAGATNNDAYNGGTIEIVGGTEECVRSVANYVGSTKTVTMDSACPFTVAVSDIVRVHVSPAGSTITTAQDDLSTITGTNGAVLDDNAITSTTVADDAITEDQLSTTAIAEIVAGILAGEVEDQGSTYTLGCAIAVVLAYAAGDATTSGGDTTYKDTSSAENRIVGTVTGSTRNVTAITCP